MLGCAARPGNLGVHRAVRGGSGSSETLERCRIPSVNSGRLTASKTTLGYFRESGAQGEGPRVRIRLPPAVSHVRTRLRRDFPEPCIVVLPRGEFARAVVSVYGDLAPM